MKDDLIKKLLKRIDESQVILKKDKVEQSYVSSRDSLVSLLSDHPHFTAQIPKMRRKYKLPTNGFSDEREALKWESTDKEKRAKLISDIDTFLFGFTFNNIYRGDIKQFTYEMTVCPSRSHKWSSKNVPSLVVVDTDEDKQVNAHLITPNSRYIQVFDWTTLKDVEKNWKKIQKSSKKEVSINTGDELRRNIWQLKNKGLNYKEIHCELKDNFQHLFKNHSGGMFDESRIGIYAKRYEESLKRLKDF